MQQSGKNSQTDITSFERWENALLTNHDRELLHEDLDGMLLSTIIVQDKPDKAEVIRRIDLYQHFSRYLRRIHLNTGICISNQIKNSKI
jgi:hypothetical protein